MLVKVDAAGLNAADVHQLTGTPFLIRLVSGLRRPKVPALGTDFAGVVEAVGSSVSHVKVGDAVMGEVSRGALAEWVTAPGKGVVRIPASCSQVEAAALPMGALTALCGNTRRRRRTGGRAGAGQRRVRRGRRVRGADGSCTRRQSDRGVQRTQRRPDAFARGSSTSSTTRRTTSLIPPRGTTSSSTSSRLSPLPDAATS